MAIEVTSALVLNGATAVYFIVGDPIAQVQSPERMTRAFQRNGANAVVVPAHVKRDNLSDFLGAASRAMNVLGFLVTVPHKISATKFCTRRSKRSELLSSVNVIRRARDGGWYGDMLDGVGFVSGAGREGYSFAKKRTLVAGAGGAGTAIAAAIAAEGGIVSLYDPDPGQLSRSLAQLNSSGELVEPTSSGLIRGYDAIVNASPVGMSDDRAPFDLSELSASTFVGDVVTAPSETLIIREAKKKGCKTLAGRQMYEAVQHLMLNFFLEEAAVQI
jgi:shikimate dehydrogenase